MISLIAIKQHLMQVKMSSLNALCVIFQTDADKMRCMLEHWMRKGKVKCCMKTAACGSQCFKCDSATTEIYEWVGVC